MPDADGLQPQTTIRRACSKSSYETPAILPYIAVAAAPVGAAQSVRARRDAPKRRKNRASSNSCVRRPFEPP